MNRYRLHVVPHADPRTRLGEPPVLTSQELAALVLTTTESPYVQDALAIDYTPEDDRYFDRQRSRVGELPDPHRFAPQLAQAVVEVMAGIRPAPQVVRWTSPEVYAVLARRSLVVMRRGLHRDAARRAPLVRSTHIHEIADGVVEVGAVVVHPERVRALAMRLAGVDHRWVVTDLVTG